MNRKKQMIEEMANDIETARKPSTFNNGHVDVTVFKTSDDIAKNLYDLGYRKIPELPKNTVLTADDIAELLTIVAKDTRKETAEKFAERLKELVADRNCNEDYEWEDVQVDGQIFVECVDEICKEISEGKV